MDDLSLFERRLAAGLDGYVGARRTIDPTAIAEAAISRGHERSSLPLPDRRIRLPRIPWRLVGAFALLGIAVGGTVAFVGSRLPALPNPPGPHNGLIAYERGGDIYFGDLATGGTTAVVTSPEADSDPIFSPDGTRIAFIRGGSTAHASILVARADGAGDPVVMPVGFNRDKVTFAWTPNSASLVVNHDRAPFSTPYFDGELTLFDASGRGEPRLLTPPLPALPGTGYFGPYAQIAQMFRPPDADRILSAPDDTHHGGREPSSVVSIFDAELNMMTQLSLRDSLREYEPYSIGSLAWSPDGSMILFGLIRTDGVQGLGRIGSFVMTADGTEVRQIGSDSAAYGAWSPDGSHVAFERCSTDAERSGAVIIVVDLVSAAPRVLEATAVADCGDPSYVGWSWSPDGSSIMVLERRGDRPLVVDVETGEASELPWQADSSPSWQRI
jgi:dipeptidyl aminopeptidase/acylaminoacyl peptidase